MSEEERKAWGAKMKAARQKKERYQEELPPEEVIIPSKTVEISNDDYASLLKRVQELETERTPTKEQPRVTASGVVGTVEKYATDPTLYPDPRARLSGEPRLAALAFPINYELKFDIGVTSYQTIDGIRTREPKFNLDLIGKVFDDAGTDTKKRFIMRRLVFFEDPDAAIVVARDNGIPVDEDNQKGFLDEMRYLRMRDWLFEVFWPPKPQASHNRREEVIGNRLVEVYEVSGEEPQTIPFDTLTKKL